MPDHNPSDLIQTEYASAQELKRVQGTLQNVLAMFGKLGQLAETTGDPNAAQDEQSTSISNSQATDVSASPPPRVPNKAETEQEKLKSPRSSSLFPPADSPVPPPDSSGATVRLYDSKDFRHMRDVAVSVGRNLTDIEKFSQKVVLPPKEFHQLYLCNVGSDPLNFSKVLTYRLNDSPPIISDLKWNLKGQRTQLYNDEEISKQYWLFTRVSKDGYFCTIRSKQSNQFLSMSGSVAEVGPNMAVWQLIPVDGGSGERGSSWKIRQLFDGSNTVLSNEGKYITLQEEDERNESQIWKIFNWSEMSKFQKA